MGKVDLKIEIRNIPAISHITSEFRKSCWEKHVLCMYIEREIHNFTEQCFQKTCEGSSLN